MANEMAKQSPVETLAESLQTHLNDWSELALLQQKDAVDGLARSFAVAGSLAQLKKIITVEVYRAYIAPLVNNPLGFATDGREYPEPLMINLICGALMKGCLLHDNHFNIIGGKLMIVRNGLAYILGKLVPGGVNIATGVPQIVPGGAKVDVVAKWKYNGKEEKLECKGEHAILVPVKGDGGVDAILTKAERRMMKKIFNQITMSRIALPDGDDDGGSDELIPVKGRVVESEPAASTPAASAGVERAKSAMKNVTPIKSATPPPVTDDTVNEPGAEEDLDDGQTVDPEESETPDASAATESTPPAKASTPAPAAPTPAQSAPPSTPPAQAQSAPAADAKTKKGKAKEQPPAPESEEMTGEIKIDDVQIASLQQVKTNPPHFRICDVTNTIYRTWNKEFAAKLVPFKGKPDKVKIAYVFKIDAAGDPTPQNWIDESSTPAIGAPAQ